MNFEPISEQYHSTSESNSTIVRFDTSLLEENLESLLNPETQMENKKETIGEEIRKREKKKRSGSWGAESGGETDNEKEKEKEIEPLLKEDDRRYVMFPIRDQEIWDMYKKQVDSFWRAEEITDIHVDIQDWNTKLSDNDRRYLSMTLAFFAASDGLVLENLAVRFMQDVQLAEARAFYGCQIFMENIHSETYSLLIDSLIKDPIEKQRLFHAMENYPCIQKKAVWAKKWINDKRSGFSSRLVAFACIEGIFFSGSFASIYWVKKRGLMPALTFSNELISRDEGLHTDFAVLLYRKMNNKLPRKRILEIIKEATEIEKEFVADALQCSLIGMNETHMKQYIEYVADRLCLQLGYQKIYGTKNPFDWIEAMSLKQKSNFFEHRVSQYSMADTSNSLGGEGELSNSDIFNLDNNF
jgi:ribonucleoside-diphosphate reductase subunit M2